MWCLGSHLSHHAFECQQIASEGNVLIIRAFRRELPPFWILYKFDLFPRSGFGKLLFLQNLFPSFF